MSQPVKHIKVYKNSMALLAIYKFTDWAIKARIIDCPERKIHTTR